MNVKKSLILKVVFGSILIAAAVYAFVWSTAPAAGLAYRFKPGQRLVYDVSFVTVSDSNFMGLDQPGSAKREGADNAVQTNLQGQLVATVIEASKDGAVVAMHLRKPTVQIASNGILALEQGEVVAGDLETPIMAQLDAQGRVMNVRFAPGVQSLSQSFARSLIAASQVAMPTKNDADVWIVHEEDPNGKYAASYKASGGTIEKQRLSYLPKPRVQRTQSFESETFVKPRGKVAIEFDLGDGMMTALDGDEKTTVLVEDRVIARSETRLKLTLKSRETAEKKELASLRAKLDHVGPAHTLSAPGDTSKQEEALHRNELGNETMDSLLKQVARRQAGNDTESDDTPLYLKLKALVYLQPEVCEQFAKEMTVVNAQGPALQLLSGALSNIGHAKAQAALQVAARARLNDWSAMMVLIPALGMVEKPTPDTEATLRSLTDAGDEQIRSAAQLSLGIIARTLSATEPERMRRILSETLAQLKNATTSEARRQNLLVLGNIGAGETLDVIKSYLGNDTPPVRSAAVSALRWLENDAVDSLLIQALNDMDENVRFEAAQSFGLRPMTAATLAAHKSALAKDTSSSVRLSLLRNVAQAQRGFGEARGIIAQAASNDLVEEVREEARRLLAEITR